MPARTKPPIDYGRALLEAWATNERVNQFLLENLDDALWRADPPEGLGRTIAAIVTHMHNVRHMWLTVSAKDVDAPPKLDRAKATRKEAMAALAKSSAAMTKLLEGAIAAGGHVKEFKPDIVAFFAYAAGHEAHHRGQIAMMSRLMGKKLPDGVNYGMWDWRARWKEAGFGSE